MGRVGGTDQRAAAITDDLVHPFLPTYLNPESSILVRVQCVNTQEGGQGYPV